MWDWAEVHLASLLALAAHCGREGIVDSEGHLHVDKTVKGFMDSWTHTALRINTRTSGTGLGMEIIYGKWSRYSFATLSDEARRADQR